MKTTPRTSSRSVLSHRLIDLRRICVGSIALFAGFANAQTTITKANNQSDLSLAGSWIGNVVPGLLDTALWDSNVTGVNTTVLGADLSLFGLRLTNPAGAVTINAGNTLTLGGGGIDMGRATQDLTLNNAVTLGGTQDWNVGAGRNLTVTGAIGDGGAFFGVTKTGTGTLTLAGANTYTGATAVNGGTLLLNFAAASAPDLDIVNTNSSLQLGGGRLTLQGAANETNSQTLFSTAFNAGLNTINVTPGASGQATLNLGTITTAINAVVRINSTGTITATGATVGTNGILGANGSTAVNVASAGYATIGLTDFAALSNGNIVAGENVLGFYQTGSYGNNFDIIANTTLANGVAQRAATVVRFNTPAATTLTGGTSNLITFGAALITPNMGANNASLTGAGVWQIIRQTNPNGPQQGTIWQNNPLGFYSVTIPIVDGREATDPSNVVKAGLGTAVFSGVNTYTGRTSIYEGALMITADNNLGGASTPVTLRGGTLFGNANFTTAATRAFTIEEAGGLAASTGNTMTVNGVVSGPGALTIGSSTLAGTGGGTANTAAIVGDGRVALMADNTYSGGTTVNRGAVTIPGINALGGANYGGLLLTNGGTVQFASALTSGSDLTIGSGIRLGAGGGGIDTNANNVSFANGLSGVGGLTKSGAGTLTLNAASTYSGNTIINGGTLRIAAASGSATGAGTITINSGAALSGSGTLGGAVTVNAGGILDPGTGVGTLILPGLTLAADSVLKFEFNSTPANDFIQVTGTNGLIIDGGKVNVLLEGTGSPFATAGTYNIFSFNGAIQGIGTSAFAVVNPAAGFIYTFGTNNNFITLTVATSGLVTNWASANGGSWNTVANWSNGVPNESGATATFGNSLTGPGIVTLDGNKTVGNVTFDNTNGYTIVPGSGGSLTFQTNTGSSSIMAPQGSHTIGAPVVLGSNLNAEVGTGAVVTLSDVVSGSRSLTKRGVGVLNLNGANSYSGNTTLEAGTLGIGNNSALGTGSLSIPSSATLRANANALAIANNINIGSGITATVDTQSNSLTLSGVIANATTNGILRKIGNGTLFLTGANTYTGGTTLGAGTLNVNSAAALSTGSVTFAGNATLQQTGALTLANNINLNAGVTGVIDTNGSDMAINGNIVGAEGGLTKVGTGVLTLNGANAFASSGNALLSANAGTVVFGAATAAPSGVGLATAGGTIDLNGFSITAGSLSGTSGVVTDNSIAGGTTTLTVNQTGNTSYAGTIDNGLVQILALTKTGTGTLTLSGNNTYSGATNAFGGNLQLDASGVINAGPLAVSTGGTFTLNGGSLTVNGTTNLNNNGGAVLSVINGNAMLNGAVTATANTTGRYLINVQNGALSAQSLDMGRSGLNFSAEPTAGSTTDGLYIQGGAVSVMGALSMGTVAGVNSSVSTRIDGGSLTVGGALTIGLNNAGRWSIVDVNGGTLTSTDSVGGILIGGPLAGSAILLVRSGTATAERIQLSSLTGATSVLSVTGGSLFVGSGGIVLGATNAGTSTVRFGDAIIGARDNWSSSLPVTLSGTATLQAADAANLARDITLSGTLSDFGSVLKTGGGTLTLSGANSYTGSTAINAGVLSVNTLADGGLPSGIGASTADAFSLALNGGTLRYTGAAATTDRTFTVGSAGATLAASGSGALKFTSATAVQFSEVDTPHTITITGTSTGDNTLAPVIGDNGAGVTSLVKNGPGTWALSGANIYTGITTINNGVLKVANTTGSATGTGAIVVNTGGAFGGTGLISGLVTVNTGGHIAPGNSVGTLTVGGLTLSTGSILDFEFNGTPLNDRVIISNASGLMINGGGFNLFAEGSTSRWTTPGTYNLLQYNGTLGGSTTNLSVLNPQNGLTYTFGSSGGFVTLTIGTTATFSNWTSTTGGSWNTAASWSSGIPNATSAGASFLGTLTAPGTVTLDGSKAVGNLQFNNTNSYTIAVGTGGTLTLNAGAGAAQVTSLSGSHTVNVPVNLASNTAVDVTNAADTISLAGNISGTGSLTKNAAGVLRLSGANTHNGTIVTGGVVEIASNGALGSGSLSFNSSATLRAVAPGLAPANPITIGSNATATVDTGTNAMQSTGVISSTDTSGGLTKVGSGTLTLGNANTYTGVTTINAGVLVANALADGGVASSIGQSTNAAANLVIDGGTLRYGGVSANTDRLFTAGPNGATLDASGTGAINFINSGSVEFSGTNTSPMITLSGSNTDLNTLAATIANNGSGNTSLNKAGTGTWLLSGTNSFTGETTISGGTLALGNPLALQRSTLDYNNQGGTLGFDALFAATLGGLSGNQNIELANSFAGDVALTVGANNASSTYAGVLSGFGSLTKVGNGVLGLSGKNTYSGATTIAAGGGALKVLTTDALSPSTTVTVNNPGGLQLGNGATLNSNVTAAVGSNEFLNVPDDGATATVGGTLGVAGGGNQLRLGITGVGATLNVTGTINTPNAGSIVFLTRGNIVFSGNSTINAAPGITFGRSTQALSVTFKDNAVANIAGGSGFGGGQANPSIAMTVQDNATVNFGAGLDLNASTAAPNQTTLNLNGGSLAATGFFKNSLGANQLTTVNFNGGTLRAAGGGPTFFPSFAGLTANVQSGGAKIDTNGFDITISQSLIHDATTPMDGGLTKSGIGTLTLAGDSQYNGSTRVTEGSLVASGSLGGTASVNVRNGSLGLGAANRINDAAAVTLGLGGILNTGGFNETLGALTLEGDATIDLGAGASILRLANSASNIWAPGTLTIAGWTGLADGQGQDEIFFGSDASGLTASQISQIRFLDPLGFAPGLYGAKLLATGELVVIPEPGNVALLMAGAGSLLMRRRRRS